MIVAAIKAGLCDLGYIVNELGVHTGISSGLRRGHLADLVVSDGNVRIDAQIDVLYQSLNIYDVQHMTWICITLADPECFTRFGQCFRRIAKDVLGLRKANRD